LAARDRRTSLKKWFGAIADAFLLKRGIITDEDSRQNLIDHLSVDLSEAAKKPARNVEGDYPRTNSLPVARETMCSDRGHRQRQSASSNPPGKSQENPIIEGRFHTAWVKNRLHRNDRFWRRVQLIAATL
jgi:hypothetical protein